MKIEIGIEAPGFELFDSEKNKINLEDYRGKTVLLLFFPLAFTSTCTKELCHVRDNLFLFNQANGIVFGISVDSLYTLAKFKDEQKLNFPLLSDFNREASKAYDCLYENFSYNMQGVSKRASFVVDKTGRIAFAEVLSNASELPDFDAINLILRSLA